MLGVLGIVGPSGTCCVEIVGESGVELLGVDSSEL
jgi:hypothetical protein